MKQIFNAHHIFFFFCTNILVQFFKNWTNNSTFRTLSDLIKLSLKTKSAILNSRDLSSAIFGQSVSYVDILSPCKKQCFTSWLFYELTRACEIYVILQASRTLKGRKRESLGPTFQYFSKEFDKTTKVKFQLARKSLSDKSKSNVPICF